MHRSAISVVRPGRRAPAARVRRPAAAAAARRARQRRGPAAAARRAAGGRDVEPAGGARGRPGGSGPRPARATGPSAAAAPHGARSRRRPARCGATMSHAPLGAVEQQRLTRARRSPAPRPSARPQAHAHEALVRRRRQVDPAARPAGRPLGVGRCEREHPPPAAVGLHATPPIGRRPGGSPEQRAGRRGERPSAAARPRRARPSRAASSGAGGRVRRRVHNADCTAIPCIGSFEGRDAHTLAAPRGAPLLSGLRGVGGGRRRRAGARGPGWAARVVAALVPLAARRRRRPGSPAAPAPAPAGAAGAQAPGQEARPAGPAPHPVARQPGARHPERRPPAERRPHAGRVAGPLHLRPPDPAPARRPPTARGARRPS